MKSTSTSLFVCAALFLCWPALACAQLVPDPNAPPHSDAPPAAQAPEPRRRSRRQRPRPPRCPILSPLCHLLGPRLPRIFRSSSRLDQLTFLKDYADQPAKTLLKDKRFHSLMKQTISSTEYHYGRDMSLSDAVQTVLDGSVQPVVVRDGRFVTVSGSNGPTLAAAASFGSISKPASRWADFISIPPTASRRPR